MLLFAILLQPALAFEPFTVQDIQVVGLQRISLGTTFNYLPIKVGEPLDNEKASAVIKALYKTGFFEDIQLSRKGDVLVIHVEERPSIAKIEVFGNEELGTDDLNNALKTIGLTEGRIFNRSLLDQIEQELHQQYFSLGKYGVKIETTLKHLERNRVAITIDIDEGDAAKIKQINIIGSHKFDEMTLLDKFELSTPTMWSGISGSGKYSKQELLGDLEKLRSYYLDRGYLHFSIDSTQVSITPDKRDVYITINVTEGEQYTVSDVKLSGKMVVPAAELRKLIEVHPGDVFSRRAVAETANKLSERLGIDGYAFANVNSVPDIDEEKRTIALNFFIDPGHRVYVRRINITGNTKTRDNVVRREIRQMEGGWLSSPLVERSKVRLQKLGFFNAVNVETPAVPGTRDQVDLNFDVEEGSTGNFTAGLGYGDTQGLLFNMSVTLNNFLGTGKRISTEINNSKVNTVYRVSYTDPYYTKEGISRGFSLHSQSTDASQANLAAFSTDTYGASVTFGFPISEYNRASWGMSFENTNLKINSLTAPVSYSDWVTENGSNFDTISTTLSWSHDTRNRAVFPDRGYYSLLSTDVALPGGDLEYYKLSIRQKYYIPLAKGTSLFLGADLGYGAAYGDTTKLPFYKNYYAGGGRSVRGYQGNSLGPRDPVSDRAIGGTSKIVTHLELFFPSPFAETERSFRLSAFVDAGNVFDSESDISFDALRSSYGVSAIWLTPVGALTFNWGWAINAEPTDKTEIFQFSIGAPF
ncbi:MAG TPA: outer membrane protein assembly factor BamA [Gammaproteobacteria bacterium]|nr:outer membrane protein assembly factor BamA [Gammaproteobacteria bacterium]